MTPRATASDQGELHPTLVATQPQLEQLRKHLSAQPQIAVDTESNSLFAYRERVCLIQFSTPEADYLIDPLGDLDPALLAGVFADPSTEKVFHAAEYDVICLRRDFGYHFANLFDTMWAARILGWPKVGLGDILHSTFDVRTNKRYQRYNWGQRPLNREALTYASLDTHYLLPLRELQAQALRERRHWDEAQEVFQSVATADSAARVFDPQDFWRIKGATRMEGQQQAILRQLYIWRDREAQRRDIPPFKILGDSTLVTVAKTCPQSRSQLKGIRGLRPHQIRRLGDRILRAVKLGLRSRPPQPPPRAPRHSRLETERYRALRAWRSELAARRGVDPDVILSNATLWALSEREPKELGDLEGIDGLGQWRRSEYGADLLRVLSGRWH